MSHPTHTHTYTQQHNSTPQSEPIVIVLLLLCCDSVKTGVEMSNDLQDDTTPSSLYGAPFIGKNYPFWGNFLLHLSHISLWYAFVRRATNHAHRAKSAQFFGGFRRRQHHHQHHFHPSAIRSGIFASPLAHEFNVHFVISARRAHRGIYS